MHVLGVAFSIGANVILAAVTAWLVVSLRRSDMQLKRYVSFMEHGPFLAYMKDAQGRYSYENKAVLQHIARVAPGTHSTLGRTDQELFPALLGKAYVEHDRMVIGQGTPNQFAETSVDADGTVRHWSSMKFPWRDGEGRSCIAGISIEVTDLRKAESEVQAIRQRFEQFLDAAPFCAYLKDADGRFLFVNKHLRATYPEVVAGRTVHEMFATDQADEFSRNDEWVRRTGSPIQCEEVAASNDGVVRHWDSFKFPVADVDRRRGVGGVSIEVTDRKNAMDQVTRSESILRRLIDVQEYEKQAICHEFHDGLMQYATTACMMLDSWLRRHSDVDGEGVVQAIHCIEQGIADGRRTMRGIRPQSLDDFGLKAAIEDYSSSLAAPDFGVEASVAADVDDLPQELQTAVFRIVQEACANARRHSDTNRIRIDVSIREGAVSLRVEDYGRGFDTASPQSTGFGLVGMSERARLLGGSCHIDSVLGRGTVVTASLPLSHA